MNIAVDIGGTKILVVAGEADGTIVRQQKVPTPSTSEQGVTEIIHLIEMVAADDTIEAIFVAAPGPINRKRGVLFEKKSPNIGWESTPIVTQLKNHFSVPVGLEQDANTAALAEAVSGAGAGNSNVLYVTVSTGVGTGIILDGHIYHGAHDTEGGHMIIPAENGGEELETAVSGKAIKRRFGQYGYEITDPHIWDAYAADLATGLHNFISLLSPGVVVIGGGVGVHFHKFYDFLQLHLAAKNPLYPLTPIVPAAHTETAVAIGALILASRLPHK